MDTLRTSISARAALLLITPLVCVALAGFACNDDEPDRPPPTATSTRIPGPTPVPGADERVTLSGTLTLDGAPLEADFLGVRIIRDGLATACQNTIPAVTQGRYEISIAADAEVRGCGASGAEVVLWAFVNDRYFFSIEAAPWPDNATAIFDASFSSDAPDGATTPVTDFKGHLYDANGGELPGGTVLEAFAGDIRCAVTSLRYGRNDDEGRFYTLIVAGPEAIPGCAEGATLTFRLDGEPAVETAINDLGRGSEGHELNLTVR
jgi:hypothetical protein